MNTSSNPIPWRPLCAGIGLFFTLGVKGVFQPRQGELSHAIRHHPLTSGAQIFGLPQATDAEATFYRIVSARNVSLGLTILTFLITGQRRALGTLLLCFTFMCGVDLAWILRIPNVQRSKVVMHLIKMVLFPVVAAKMLEWI
jgi:hypothetical protein